MRSMMERKEDAFNVALPGSQRAWVTDQAAKMGLSSPDNFVLLLVRMEKQRQDLDALMGTDYRYENPIKKFLRLMQRLFCSMRAK